MRYHEVLPMDRAALESAFGSGNEDAITAALLSAAFYDPDWRWVQNVCLRYLDHEVANVRANAAMSIGHLARIHGTLDLEVVISKLTAMKNDSAVAPWIEDALEEIHFFIKVN